MTALEDLAAAFIGPLEAAGGPILAAYQDIADVWTIGFGTTYYQENGQQVYVKEGLVWTAEQCMDAFTNYIGGTVSMVVSANTQHSWTANMIVALCSFAENIGATAYRSSSVLRLHNQGNKQAAADAFLLWDQAHVDGQLVSVPGLLVRRRAEAAKYLT